MILVTAILVGLLIGGVVAMLDVEHRGVAPSLVSGVAGALTAVAINRIAGWRGDDPSVALSAFGGALAVALYRVGRRA